ncbi:hypothetical protein HPB51_023896 [Rhipicephalus microplus]|uniref:Uncharacterized protein n=1 Tax=Rhipicephalus microplus TaxID=6941 RepID=A0A9J6DD20_RHIMP|nr:hypothetical protein HPB51_023896 [Rhipicephalus microplus]
MHGGLAYGIGVSRYGAFLQLLFKSNRLRLGFGLKNGVANFISDHGSPRQNWRCDLSGQQLLELFLHNGSHHFPQCFAAVSQVHYTGIDKNVLAVKLAEENASQLGMSKRVSCYVAEVTSTGLKCLLPHLIGTVYDVIVSNPPYIAIEESRSIEPEVLRHEDHAALFAGVDGLDVVRGILQLSKTRLKVGGHLFIEVGLSHPPLIQAMLAAQEHSEMFKLLAVHPDFTLRPSVIARAHMDKSLAPAAISVTTVPAMFKSPNG